MFYTLIEHSISFSCVFYHFWFSLVSSCVSCRYGFVLFLHAFLTTVTLSYFFACILLLWLCTVSVCFTFAKSEFMLIPLYKGIMGFLPYIGLGLLTYFAFFSLHLFTTLALLLLLLPLLFFSFLFFFSFFFFFFCENILLRT